MAKGGGGPNDTPDEETPLNSTINTTPLVDVMLVMLIIFLITVPVVVATKKVALPEESNQPSQTKPENINITVDSEGKYYWNVYPRELAEIRTLMVARLKKAVDSKAPIPEVQINGDGDVFYGYVGDVVEAARLSGFIKIGFITKPTM